MAGVRRRLTCARLSSEPALVDGMMYDVVADPKDGVPVETPFVVSEFLDALCGEEESPSGWDGYSMPKKLNSLLELPKEAKDWEVQDDREEVSVRHMSVSMSLPLGFGKHPMRARGRGGWGAQRRRAPVAQYLGRHVCKRTRLESGDPLPPLFQSTSHEWRGVF